MKREVDIIDTNDKLTYWKQQEASPIGMMLNPDALEFEYLERSEIISYLPDLVEKNVLELGAGIGRYTEYFASVAKQVAIVEFVEKFIQVNQAKNSHFGNIQFHCENIINASFASNYFDFVFINWLLMYLEDEEVVNLINSTYEWLKPGGYIFIRESCFTSSNPNSSHSNTYYRDSVFYEPLFKAKFEIVNCGNCKIYQQRYGNKNQLFWLLQKNPKEFSQ